MVEQANPTGDIYVITDNIASRNSKSTREWLQYHPRIKHAFIPVSACWLHLHEAWWRIFRREAVADQTFADDHEIDQATQQTTTALNRSAKPWIWGSPSRNPDNAAATLFTASEEQCTRTRNTRVSLHELSTDVPTWLVTLLGVCLGRQKRPRRIQPWLSRTSAGNLPLNFGWYISLSTLQTPWRPDMSASPRAIAIGTGREPPSPVRAPPGSRFPDNGENRAVAMKEDALCRI